MHSLQDLPIRTVVRFVCRECFSVNNGSLPHVVLLVDAFLAEFPGQRALNAACARGASVRVLEFLLRYAAPYWLEASRLAVEGGHLHVLRWMFERQDGRGAWKSDFYANLVRAARNGHVEVAKWLLDRGIRSFSCHATERAAHFGHLEVVQLLCHDDSQNCTEGVMYCAGASGNLDLLLWLRRHRGPVDFISIALEGAAAGGNLELLQKLHNLFPGHLTSAVMDRAGFNGHLDVMKWLRENGGQQCSSSIFSAAARHGHLDIVEWLHQNYKFQMNSNTIDRAAKEGHLEVVKWIQERDLVGCTVAAMDEAATNGHLEVVQWLHEKRQEGCTTKAMDGAARNGHLSVVQWLHHNRQEGCTTTAMDGAASSGHLDVIRWLGKNRSEGCTFEALHNAAWHGHNEVVRWLYNNYASQFSEVQVANAVDSAVLYGCLGVVQELEKLGLFKHQNYLAGLTKAVFQHGRVRMVEWLLGLGYRLTVTRDKLYITPAEPSNPENAVVVMDQLEALSALIYRGRIDMVRWLSGRGCKLDSKHIELAAKHHR